MEERRTSVFENGLIWFGAAVSIARLSLKHDNKKGAVLLIEKS